MDHPRGGSPGRPRRPLLLSIGAPVADGAAAHPRSGRPPGVFVPGIAEERMTIDPSRRSLRLAPFVGVAAAIVGVAAYLAASQATLRLGFPLDDAWIHPTYARNLALRGEWSFVPGQASGGSTAPLWTILLAIGARLGAGPRPWAYPTRAGGLGGAAGAGGG